MKYSVELTKQAAKALRKLPAEVRQAITNKIQELANDPFAPQLDVEKMQGREGFRLRVGNWRIIYELNNKILLISIIKIGNRKEVYQ